MPLPNPKKDEQKKTFISRCMSDKVMQREFKDQDQRLAVCNTRWEKRKKK